MRPCLCSTSSSNSSSFRPSRSLLDPRVGGDFNVRIGLAGERGNFVYTIGRGGKLHGFGGNGYEMLERVDALGIDINAAGVGHRVNNVETCLARTKGKQE